MYVWNYCWIVFRGRTVRGVSVWGICAISGRLIGQVEIDRNQSENNIIVIVYIGNIIGMEEYNSEICKMVAFVTLV